MYVCAEKYNHLITGEAREDVENFLSEKGRTLAEFKAKIHAYRELSREITSLDDVVFFDMFQLECHDIKHGLNEIVQDLTMTLVRQLASQHKEENERFVERCGPHANTRSGHCHVSAGSAQSMNDFVPKLSKYLTILVR